MRIKVNAIFVLLLSAMPLAQARYNPNPLNYFAPDGRKSEIDVLFGRWGGFQDDIEVIYKDNSKKPESIVFVSGLDGFEIRWDEAGMPLVVIPPNPPQKVTFENGRYRLLPSDISLAQFNALPVFDKHAIEHQSQRYIEFRTANMNKPNLSLEYRRETVEGCGTVKFMYRSDASGRSTAQEIVFEKLGKLSISTYQINKITCTASGQIILQLAIFEATGGKKDYFINKKGEVEEAWDYRPAIAIVETGISN